MKGLGFIIVCGMSLIAAAGVFAQDKTPATTGDVAAQDKQLPGVGVGVGVFEVYVENDSINFDSTDMHYTHGTAINIAWQPEMAQEIAEIMPFSEGFDPADSALGVTVGQLMYTPEKIAWKTISYGDRPYAGYLYAGLYWERTDAQRTTLDHIQLDVGTTGDASLAGPAQKWVHSMSGAQRPNGWRYQLQSEPTVQLTIRKKWRLVLAGDDWTRTDGPVYDMAPKQQTWWESLGDNFRIEAIPQVALSAGTMARYAEVGGEVRAGWNMSNDFGPGRIADVATGRALARARQQGFSIYAYGRAAARAVQYDHLLDGSEFQHEEYTVDSRPLVGEFQVGVAAAYQYQSLDVELGYSMIFLTDSFYNQQRDDKYATMYLKVAYWF